MFPFDVEDEEIEAEDNGESQEPSDYEIDFNTGKLTGRIITGLDAIKQRVLLIFGTDRYAFPQYSWDCGSELSTLIGKTADPEYVTTESKRMVEDALSVVDQIDGIEDFECVIEGDRITVSFTIQTPYGEDEVRVDV